MSIKRVFLIVLDSFGIGELPDAEKYGDSGSNTLASIAKSKYFNTPNLKRLGLFNIDGVNCCEKAQYALGSYARMAEVSAGKDTTIGHWEIAGIKSDKPLPTYPNGFPDEIISEYKRLTGRGVLCNKPYSGTQLLLDYGRQHMQSGDLIVYTSADSVFQVAAHENIVPVSELYRCCELARSLLQGEHGVGRVIARPFEGEYPNFKRTSNRHDYSLVPPAKTVLDCLSGFGFETIGVGKINDIFAGKGITQTCRSKNNSDGMRITSEVAKQAFNGLCFINLVDFDMLYGHRNDVDGYAKAMSEFDAWLGGFTEDMNDSDVLIITADHGCDPATESTDHSREYTPMLAYGKTIKQNNNLKTRGSFADIAATIAEIFGISADIYGTGFLKDIYSKA